MQPGVGYRFISSSQGVTLDIGDPWPESTQDATNPLQVINVSFNAGGKVIYQVKSGTINNLVPLLDDYISSTQVKLDRVTSGVADPPTGELLSTNYDATTKTSYIVLRSGPDATTNEFPSSDVTSARYPQVIGGNNPVITDTDTQGFVLLATITVDNITTPTTFTVSQNVTGSLWADRIKLAGITARYYYARI